MDFSTTRSACRPIRLRLQSGSFGSIRPLIGVFLLSVQEKIFCKLLIGSDATIINSQGWEINLAGKK